VLPDTTPLPTLIVPSGLMPKPVGAPTMLSDTEAAGGGVTPLSESLASTLGVAVPGAMLLKLSSPATRVPVLTLRVTVAVPHSAAFGAGRQAW